MRMRTKLSIITAVGVSALLLSVVTASFTFRAQAAYAQEEENVQTGDVHLSLLSHSVRKPFRRLRLHKFPLQRHK